jgi:dipeptidyl-peptidase 4
MLNQRTRLAVAIAIGVSLASSAVSFGQAAAPAAPSTLTLERIFAAREFATERFGPSRWLPDGEAYTTLEPSTTAKGARDLVLCAAATGETRVLVPATALVPAGAREPITIEDYAWSPDGQVLIVFTNTARVWRQNTRGDYWTYELGSGRLRKLGASFPASTLMFAKLSPNGRLAAYVQKNNLYVEDLANGQVRALTSDGNDDIVNGTSDWVYEEEFGLRDGFRWSPDSRSIAFWRFDTSGVPVFSMINNTDALYPTVSRFKYPKAGETNSAVQIGVVPAAGGPAVWMRVPGDSRNTYIPRMEWAGGSAELVLQHLNRLQNTNDVLLCNAATGQAKTVFTDQDAAWVEVMDDFQWIDGGRSLLWASERDGWRHLFAVPRDGGAPKLLTPGAYDVVSLEGLDEKAGWLYVIASPDDATKRFLYRVPLVGAGAPERLAAASQPGTHRADISPSAHWAIHTYSALGTPPVTDLVRLPSGDRARVLAANQALHAKVAALSPSRIEYFKVPVADGVQVDGWRILPPGFDPSRRYPLLVYVYGEPAGQTVQDTWGGNTYLYHLMLAEHGYVVASFDNRGTPAPRGRAWRKSVYRQGGILAAADQAAAARAALAAWPFVDRERVGIWGWSGGGSMTLNAMFRYPDLYKTGISVASVPNQRLYDSIYQERYMGLPKDNADGYRDGSPLTFASNLQGRLLIVHGTGDDNVHYQGFEMLVNELVARGRPFDMMSYPNRSHGISEGAGTTVHLYSLFLRYLEEHLAGGRSAAATPR